MSAPSTKLLAGLVVGLLALAAPARGQARPDTVPGVTYVEQPSGIALAAYVAAWPELAPYANRLGTGARDSVKADLRRLPAPSAAALNLLAQLEREDDRLDQAESLIRRAIAAEPRQHLHHFQQAMVFFARLSAASGLSRWTWQQRTRDAYQRAFDLDSTPVPYRYYLVYTYLQAPGIAGGDKDRALRMAEAGLAMGQREFYVVRADVHRQRGEFGPALADYDQALSDSTFKLNSFLAAGRLAIERRDWPRARRYLDWAVHCRPDSPRTHEGLGDYRAAIGDTLAAVAAYRQALRVDPQAAGARTKLVRLHGAP